MTGTGVTEEEESTGEKPGPGRTKAGKFGEVVARVINQIAERCPSFFPGLSNRATLLQPSPLGSIRETSGCGWGPALRGGRNVRPNRRGPLKRRPAHDPVVIGAGPPAGKLTQFRQGAGHPDRGLVAGLHGKACDERRRGAGDRATFTNRIRKARPSRPAPEFHPPCLCRRKRARERSGVSAGKECRCRDQRSDAPGWGDAARLRAGRHVRRSRAMPSGPAIRCRTG